MTENSLQMDNEKFLFVCVCVQFDQSSSFHGFSRLNEKCRNKVCHEFCKPGWKDHCLGQILKSLFCVVGGIAGKP